MFESPQIAQSVRDRYAGVVMFVMFAILAFL